MNFQKAIWRFPLAAMTITAAFWAVWYLAAGNIPDVSITGNGWNLSFARLWDIPAAGLIAAWLVVAGKYQNSKKYFLEAISKFGFMFMILCSAFALLAAGSWAVGFASGVAMTMIASAITSIMICLMIILSSDIGYKIVSLPAIPIIRFFQSKPVCNIWAWLTGNK